MATVTKKQFEDFEKIVGKEFTADFQTTGLDIDAEEKGTVRDWSIVATKIGFNPNNFKRLDKALMINMVINKVKGALYCSQSVGDKIRNGSYGEDDIMDLRVVRVQTQDKSRYVFKVWDSQAETQGMESLESLQKENLERAQKKASMLADIAV